MRGGIPTGGNSTLKRITGCHEEQVRGVEGSCEANLVLAVRNLANKFKRVTPVISSDMNTFTGSPVFFQRSLFSGALSQPKSGFLSREAPFRKYRAVLSSRVTIRGNIDSHDRGIVYEVGARIPNTYTDKGAETREATSKALACDDASLIKPDLSVPTNTMLANEFTGMAKKHSNFSGQWHLMDLSGMVCRIAKGLAAQSVYGSVTTADLRGDAPVNITVLSSLDSPVTASVSQVFIPRLVDSVISPSVFSVLAAAANGEGSTVVTDVLALDASDNRPIVPACGNAEFARACVEALRLLAANYAAANAGEIFAYALTRGIHSVLSVVAHTDEGGYLRRVLRACGHRAPYGGIHYGLDGFTGFPALASTSPQAVAAWVDSFALLSAAAVAHCDPCTVLNGDTKPTVFTNWNDPIVEGGSNQDGTNVHGSTLGRRLASESGAFCERFCKALAELLGIPGTGTAAVTHMVACFRVAGQSVDRHLKLPSIAPYFWVEPTSLIPRGFFSSTAEAGGCGAKVTVGEEHSEPLFSDIVAADHLGGDSQAYVVSVGSARKCGLIGHLNAHPENGLGAITIRQMDPEAVVHPGGRPGVPGTIRERMLANETLGQYLWTRGQSPLPAPGEFLNNKISLGIVVHHAHWSGDEYTLRPEHVPTSSELLTGRVSWRVSSPQGMPAGHSNYESRSVRRARTQAASALDAARVRAHMYGETKLSQMELSFSAPALPSSRTSVLAEPGTAPERERDPPAGADPVVAIATKRAADPGVTAEGDRERSGVRPARPAVHSGSQTGPRVDSSLFGVGASGAAARALPSAAPVSRTGPAHTTDPPEAPESQAAGAVPDSGAQ